MANTNEIKKRIDAEIGINIKDMEWLDNMIKKEKITNPAHSLVKDREMRQTAINTLEYVKQLIY